MDDIVKRLKNCLNEDIAIHMDLPEYAIIAISDAVEEILNLRCLVNEQKSELEGLKRFDAKE